MTSHNVVNEAIAKMNENLNSVSKNIKSFREFSLKVYLVGWATKTEDQWKSTGFNNLKGFDTKFLDSPNEMVQDKRRVDVWMVLIIYL